jgi:hypothetical protein
MPHNVNGRGLALALVALMLLTAAKQPCLHMVDVTNHQQLVAFLNDIRDTAAVEFDRTFKKTFATGHDVRLVIIDVNGLQNDERNEELCRLGENVYSNGFTGKDWGVAGFGACGLLAAGALGHTAWAHFSGPLWGIFTAFAGIMTFGSWAVFSEPIDRRNQGNRVGVSVLFRHIFVHTPHDTNKVIVLLRGQKTPPKLLSDLFTQIKAYGFEVDIAD